MSGGSINLNAGVSISGTGNVNLGNGAYFVENAASGMQGGLLTASYGYVGYSGTGTFNQVAGTNTDSGSFFNGGVFLGYNAGANGTYNLSGTATLSTYTEAVGYNGVGTFNQTGGVNSTSFFSPLYIGYNNGSRGVYNLSGTGSLSGGEYVGNSGSGTLNQSGGTNNPGTIYIGYNSGSVGVYNLSARLADGNSLHWQLRQRQLYTDRRNKQRWNDLLRGRHRRYRHLQSIRARTSHRIDGKHRLFRQRPTDSVERYEQCGKFVSRQ